MVDYNSITDYDERYQSYECLKENSAISTILCEYIRESDRVLDLGCGTGFSLDECKKINLQNYMGIDASPFMIERAKKKHKATFIVSKAEEIEVSGYDVVLSLFSIPYIGIKSIETIGKALKPGGVLIAVYYDKPYLNKASVYSNRKLQYLFKVMPNVKRIIHGLQKRFFEIENKPLTDSKTYRISVFINE